MDSHQTNLLPHLPLLNSPLHFNPTSSFLGITFDCTLSFSIHLSLLKAKFFPRLKTLRCISAFLWGPSKESLFLVCKAFLRPLFTYDSPEWFSVLATLLFSIFSFTSNSLADLPGTVFSLLYYQVTMGSRTLVSPGERRG